MWLHVSSTSSELPLFSPGCVFRHSLEKILEDVQAGEETMALQTANSEKFFKKRDESKRMKNFLRPSRWGGEKSP